MGPHMNLEMLLANKRRRTNCALKRTIPLVSIHVGLEVALVSKGHLAFITGEILFTVRQHMPGETLFSPERGGALRAGEELVVGMRYHMGF